VHNLFYPIFGQHGLFEFGFEFFTLDIPINAMFFLLVCLDFSFTPSKTLFFEEFPYFQFINATPNIPKNLYIFSKKCKFFNSIAKNNSPNFPHLSLPSPQPSLLELRKTELEC